MEGGGNSEGRRNSSPYGHSMQQKGEYEFVDVV